MMLNTKLRRTSLALIAVVLMLSVFAMTAFAEDEILMAGSESDQVLDVQAPEADEELETGSAAAGTEETTPVKDETTDEHAGHDHDHEDETEDEGFTTSDLVLLIIFGVALIAVIVVCIIKREQVGKFLRSLKSEFKKIVWSPWNQVRKNTIVVIVVVVAIAVVIGLLDFLFGHGITELKNLINPAA